MSNTKELFSRRLIMDYIEGKSVGDIDSLENDSLFMEEVKKYTETNPEFMFEVLFDSRENRQYIYKTISDSIKKKYKFASLSINSFTGSPRLIANVCKDYLRLNDDSVLNEQTTEILARTVTTLKEYKNSNDVDDEILSELCEFGSELKKRYEYNKKMYEYKFGKDKGLGFKYICEQYNNNPCISWYFASVTLARIINNNSIANKIYEIRKLNSHVENGVVKPLTEQDKINMCINLVLSVDPDFKEYVDTHFGAEELVTEKIRKELNRNIIEITPDDFIPLNEHEIRKVYSLSNKKRKNQVQ